MNMQPNRNRSGESKEMSKNRSGPKEVLTEKVARKIVRMIEQFPDENIAVTWDNVTRHTKLRFGYDFRRNVLSQKSWNDRKLIADAFQGAKEVQRRQSRDMAPKYANEPRSRLLLRVSKLQSEKLALRAELDQLRDQRYDEIYSLLDTRTPLNRLIKSTEEHTGESKRMSENRAGPKEVLTEEFGRRIACMIRQFPDTGIAVIWDNVIQHTKLRFGHDFQRNVLSQKSWDGRKLIAEAFQEAKEIQRQRPRDIAPNYDNEPRSRLLLLVAKLQSEKLALRDQLDRVRAQQYDDIYKLLDTRTSLNRLIESRAEHDSAHIDEFEKKTDRKPSGRLKKYQCSQKG